MNRVNQSSFVGTGNPPSSRAINIDRLTQSDSSLKTSNGGICKGRVQGVGPDGKVYVTTLVERAGGRPGAMCYFANGKRLDPTTITNLNDALAHARQRIADGSLGQLALGNQNAFASRAVPALRIELGHRPSAQDGALQVARSAGVTISQDGGVDLPNNEFGGQLFAQMQHTRRQRNSSQPMEPIAKPAGASALFIQGYNTQRSRMTPQHMLATAAGNKRVGNGLGWAPPLAAMPRPRPSGPGAPSTQLARKRADTAPGEGKAQQSQHKAY